jgi:DNA-3-methyladenine glycosylase II
MQEIIAELTQQDPILRELIARDPVPCIQSTKQVFHDVMSCLIEQQIHYRSTKHIFEKALATAGITLLTPANFAHFEEVAMSSMKLSVNKLATINRFVSYWEEKQPNFFEQSDEAVKKALSSIKGIGPWTIDMILLYTLERPSVFPVDDYHLKQIMTARYQLDPTKRLTTQMKEIAATWGKHQSLAVLYLLQSKTRLKTAK